MTVFWSNLIRRLGYAVASVIILLATLMSATNLLSPYLDQHKDKFTALASDLLKAPVAINHVYVSWDVYEPQLAFDHVAILDKSSLKPSLVIEKIIINLNISQSLLALKPIIDEIRVIGVHVTLHEMLPGQFHIEGLRNLPATDSMTGAEVKSDDVFAWVFSMSRLLLKKIDIQYVPAQGENKLITLERFSLENDKKNHFLKGLAWLHQDIPTKVKVDTSWYGDFSDLKHISANINLYLEGIWLPQFWGDKVWHQLQIKDGLASVKVSARWDNNQLQKAQANFQMYQLEWQSLATQKTQMISRVSGVLNWQRQDAFQIISGEDILIDLPDHLWPTMNFAVKYTSTEQNDYSIRSADISYIDLDDVKRLAINNGLLSDSVKQMVTTLALKGEGRSLHAETKNTWTDPADISCVGQFTGLSFKQWKKLPGINNLTGKFMWNSNKGEINLNSQDASFSLSPMFSTPWMFDQLGVTVDVTKDEKNAWLINVKNFTLKNLDLNAQMNMNLTVPENDSPEINLTGHFNVTNVGNIARYFPMPLLDVDLQHWLAKAFRGGSVTDGEIILQGKLSDFPFEKTSGKFVVSGVGKNVDFYFAPNWPALQQINGQLSYVGSNMIINIFDAKIANIPIENAHAVITHFGGVEPTILSVEAAAQTDLTKAFSFVQNSPLQNTLGKDLAAMKISGPMVLGLQLSMPLKNPSNTHVLGQVSMNNASVSLPDWNLRLDGLQGALNFTEQTIDAKNLQGNLWGAPVTLVLSTKQDSKNNSYVQADLKGRINLALLEKWMNVSFSEYATGETDFSAELHLTSHDKNLPTELILTSNLQGVSVNLPEQFSKKAEDRSNLRVDLFVIANQPLKIKVDYATLLSAALNLQFKQQKWQLLNGELRLGPGANWQTQPGILISGQVDELDWNKIQKYLPEESTEGASLVRGVDLNVGLLSLFQQTFKNIRVQLAKINNAWQVSVNNPQIKGQIIVPLNIKQQAIDAKFDHFYLTTSDTVTKANVDPKKLPALTFVGDDVRVNEKKFGGVKLVIAPSKSGLTIKNLNLQSTILQLNSIGNWQSLNGKFFTRLQGEASASKVSDVLTQWGFNTTNFVCGKGEAKFDLSWPDAPFYPSEKGLTGSLSLYLGEGRIIDIGESETKMGFGKLLSLLSLQSIQRRLSLNFSDLTEKGYSFDSITGDIKFVSGDALTDNLHIAGPIADIKISGRIGLAAKDFDMRMDITPHLTSSLPLVATAVGGPIGPIAGVATWAVDKLVTSKIITYHYQITGPWDKPEWKQVSGR